MPVKRYDPATKAAFIKAASDARASKKPWAEAFAAAKETGYSGTLGGIQQLLHRKPSGRKPGRPRKADAVTVTTAKRGRPAKDVVSVNGLTDIELAINGIVRERVRKAMGKAIEALQASM